MTFSRIPVELFYSYSHKDEELREELEAHLASMKREGLIRVWHDRKIGAGDDWNGEIAEHLNTADIILLLISPNFLGSDYCNDLEVKRALERHADGSASVIPVILRPCDWTSAPFAKIQSLPKNARPISRWEDRDEAFLDVATGLRLLIQRSVRVEDAPPSELESEGEVELVRESLRARIEPVSQTNINSLPAVMALSGSHPRAVYPIEILSQTENSVIEKYCIDDEYLVLKKTKKSLCQFATLEKMVGKKYAGYEKSISARVATPTEVGMDGDYVWELHPFYDGVSLAELIKQYGPVFVGSDLGALHNAIFMAVSGMHDENILHRDISPSNILMVDSGKFLILDCAFCCDESLPQTPVSNYSYTAPEQRLGNATFVSDYYSIAATIYFFANGYAPDHKNPEEFENGLRTMDWVGFKPSFRFSPGGPGILGTNRTIQKLYTSLLDQQASNRPSSRSEVILDEITVASKLPDITNIFDLGKFGYLVVEHGNADFVSNAFIKEFLRYRGVSRSQEIQKIIRLIMES